MCWSIFPSLFVWIRYTLVCRELFSCSQMWLGFILIKPPAQTNLLPKSRKDLAHKSSFQCPCNASPCSKSTVCLLTFFGMRTAVQTELLQRRWNVAQLWKKLIKNEGDDELGKCNGPGKQFGPRTKGMFWKVFIKALITLLSFFYFVEIIVFVIKLLVAV